MPDPKPYCNPKVPTYDLDIMLGRTHVSTSPQEVEKAIREQIAIALTFGEGAEWTPAIQDQTVRYALWRHRRNFADYEAVMS